MKKKSRNSQTKENKENLLPPDLPKRMAKGSSLNNNNKKQQTEETWDIGKEERTQ